MWVWALAAQAVAAVAAPASSGVTSYPAEFFAAQQPANAADMVLRLPGFTLDTGSGARGYEGAGGNVLIDGERPASKSDDLENILRRLPASRVLRIDVIRGGAPGVDMQGKSVIANIVRKPGGEFRGLAAAALNQNGDGRSAGTGRLEASGGWRDTKWELGISGGRGYDDGVGPGRRQIVDTSGRVTPATIDAEGDGLTGQAVGLIETPVLGGKLRLNTRIAREKFKNEETDRIAGPSPYREDSLDYFYDDTDELGGAYTRAFGARTQLELVGLGQQRDRSYISDFVGPDGASSFALNRKTEETIARAVLKYGYSDRLSLEVGAETARNTLDSATRLSVDGAVIALPAANVRVTEDRAEVFVKGVWRPADGWTVESVLRQERSELASSGDVVLGKTLTYLKPRVTVAWDVRPATQIRARVEREVGQLNFNDFVASGGLSNASGVLAGNPDLDPAQSWVGEIAVEQRFWAKGSVIATYRHFDSRDVVDRGLVFASDGSIFDRPANIGSGRKDELAVAVNVPLDRLQLTNATLRGEVTRRWSKVTDPATGAPRRLSGERPLEWEANFTQDVPAWRLSWGVDVFGGWRETYYRYNSVETVKLKTFVKPFVEWRPRTDVNVRLEIPNATNRGLRRTYSAWDGVRKAGVTPSIDDRDYQSERGIYIRIRKMFGA